MNNAYFFETQQIPDHANIFDQFKGNTIFFKLIKNTIFSFIAKITGRGRNTIYKILKEELNYIPYNRLIKGD